MNDTIHNHTKKEKISISTNESSPYQLNILLAHGLNVNPTNVTSSKEHA